MLTDMPRHSQATRNDEARTVPVRVASEARADSQNWSSAREEVLFRRGQVGVY